MERFLDGLETVHHLVEVARLHNSYLIHSRHSHSFKVLDLHQALINFVKALVDFLKRLGGFAKLIFLAVRI